LKFTKKNLLLLTFLHLLVLLASCGGSGSSAPAAPKIGINTATGWSDSPFISRDGQRLYFMYSRYDFGPWILSGGTTMPVASGPDRPGLHKATTNPFDESDIYMSTKNPDGTWSEPVNLGFNGAYGDSSGMEIDNGNTFIWLRGNGTTNDIVIATKNINGSWTTPTALGSGINDHTAGVIQDNPFLSPDGASLYFVSNRASGSGGRDIWLSTKSGGVWSAPVNIGAPVNTAGDEDQPWISGVDAYWNVGGTIQHCVSTGSNCAGTPDTIVIPGCAYTAEVSMPDDELSMYFACGNLTTGRVKIMYSVKQPGGSWGAATAVD
jgi:hypothetical protein